MRNCFVVLYGLAFALPPLSLVTSPQSARTPPNKSFQSHDPQNDVGVPTLRVTTREVLIDLIALDRHNQPVLDLKPSELQVSAPEEQQTGKKNKRRWRISTATGPNQPITSLSIFDPNSPSTSAGNARTGFRIMASCLERSTVHYLLAFHPGPEGWTSGFHRMAVTTKRRGVKLYYRHQYYVGLAAPDPNQPVVKKQNVKQILQQSSCYYPVDPLSIVIQARLLETGRKDVVRYLVSVDASSLSFLTLDSNPAGRELAGLDRRVQLDYGTCNFDQGGKPVSYFHATIDQVLNSADYARALDRGFPHILEFPASEHIALTRVVLRDRATGNMGAADVILPQDEDILRSKRRPVGSFGSIVPAPHSFCGDVYELPETSDELPDFGELDPIGSLYTSSLDVPNQVFSNTSGIPGVTPRTNLFGIDYHASFWVSTPGEFQFSMASDDGAILQVDDKQVINLDGLHQVNEASGRIELEPGLHTIHVPYYQGACCEVALALWVKPPGTTNWVVFDLKDYSGP